jgi:nucleoside-diphosphate-sugar epimerase
LKKKLVSGGAGFIGSHLCERLLARGDDVLCVDNYFTGTKRNVQHLFSNPMFELMRHDVTFPLYIEVDRERVLSLVGSKSKLAFLPLPQDDPKQRRPVIELAHAKLGGWEPKVGLEDGLKENHRLLWQGVGRLARRG